MIFFLLKLDWDDFLFDFFYKEWKFWVQSLSELEEFQIFRQYSFRLFKGVQKREVYIYVDVFKEVIVVVVFLKLYGSDLDLCIISFFMGKVKVVLFSGYIVFRFELCVVVLVVQLVDVIYEQLKIDREDFFYYFDS